MAAAPNKFRTYALTGSFAAITATGAWYGAGLKTRQEYSQERKLALQVPVAERIQQLEAAKSRLQQQRAELQTKIDRLLARASGPKDSSQQQQQCGRDG